MEFVFCYFSLLVSIFMKMHSYDLAFFLSLSWTSHAGIFIIFGMLKVMFIAGQNIRAVMFELRELMEERRFLVMRGLIYSACGMEHN